MPETSGSSNEFGTSSSITQPYNTEVGYKASTTGNIYGIYDMSGGAWEYVMGYYSGASTTWGASSKGNYAGFSSKPDSKYYDDYTTTNTLTACNGGICYGHAISETTSWYSDYAYFVKSSKPWFYRGGSYDYGAGAGAFYRSSWDGDMDEYDPLSFRLVLVKVGDSLQIE